MVQKDRLDFLDGLRGLAILMVICLHYFVQIYDVPRSIFYNKQTPLPHLDTGVQLFFALSGYVIFMTLDKTPGFFQFIARRWIRLFPAMLAATLFIAIAAHFIPYRPGGVPRLIDLIPGLSLLGANAVSALSRIHTDGLERGFWSIYVEVRFYLMFGICYYTLGRQRAFYALLACSLLLLFLLQGAPLLGAANAARAENLFGKMLIGYHLPWFLLGMHIYLYHFKSQPLPLVLIVANALAHNLDSLGSLLMAAAIPLLMYAAFNIDAAQQFFRNRLFLFFGFVSYPLYLLNDSLGRGIIRGLYAKYSEQMPFELMGVATLPLILIPTWIIAAYIEPSLQKWLKRKLFPERRGKWVPAR